MQFAQILNGKVHWIFEDVKKPEFAPNIKLVDITGNSDVQEGWNYDAETQTFLQPEPQSELDPKATIEEVAEETLLETKYQTFLLEMMI